MATVTVVRYKRRKRLGDDKSPMMYLLKPKAGESKIYSIDSLAQEIESIGSLSVGRRVARYEVLCPCDEKSACGGE